ncbi:glycogen debranching N-terminal domain-containing protein [Tessaracoccus aquimaris]|uniref:glycogen debranching N-terminal domain-containing protein n=1 Tax=Tessaracoccus aquimaris TaxID=1332264 RepID=UPI001D0573F2|nr:glycogen debranching N-terminal domain-containing protein [Tessaracoccus aquimaris]
MRVEKPGRQPFLNQRTVVVCAPTQVWSGNDGDFGSEPIDGIYQADWRLISGGTLRVGGEPLEVAGCAAGDSTWSVTGLARGIDDDTPDPRVLVERRRVVSGGASRRRCGSSTDWTWRSRRLSNWPSRSSSWNCRRSRPVSPSP